jgi:hypothetical protein
MAAVRASNLVTTMTLVAVAKDTNPRKLRFSPLKINNEEGFENMLSTKLQVI